MHPDNLPARTRNLGDDIGSAMFPVKPEVVRDILPTAIRQCGFRDPKIDEVARVASARTATHWVGSSDC
jgi:hypothetical protein